MGSIPTSAAKREGAMWPARTRVSCWQCGSEHAPVLFCPACDAIQPLPEQADHFQVLGLPRHLVIDLEALQRRYYELHRRLHPDLHQTGPQAARQASLRNTAAVNLAYRTLRDPIDRGEYWLALLGEGLGTNNNRVPADLAALVFEVQEQLEELRDARHGDNAAALKCKMCEIRGELAERRKALLNQLQDNYARWDADAADVGMLTRQLKDLLSALAYLGTLMRDVDKELEN
jgi:molecular chaperone HscB